MAIHLNAAMRETKPNTFGFPACVGLLLLRNSINYRIWSIEIYRLDCVLIQLMPNCFGVKTFQYFSTKTYTIRSMKLSIVKRARISLKTRFRFSLLDIKK
jgi:hypothetical protein